MPPDSHQQDDGEKQVEIWKIKRVGSPLDTISSPEGSCVASEAAGSAATILQALLAVGDRLQPAADVLVHTVCL